jgi:hypothetical protein
MTTSSSIKVNALPRETNFLIKKCRLLHSNN